MTTVSMDPRLRARRVEVMRLRGKRRLRALLLLIVGSGLVLAGWWLVMRSSLFDVDQVTVRGVEQTSVRDVIDASGIVEGEALVEVDVMAARASIAALPWVDTVASDRTMGGEVSFVVTERRAVAVVPGAEGWLLVDADGRVLELVDEVPADVVVIAGTSWQVTPGGWIGEGALQALEVAALLPSGLRPKVSSIQTANGELDLVLFGGGVVNLGDATELDQKFLSALTMVVRIDISCLDRIDVRAPPFRF